MESRRSDQPSHDPRTQVDDLLAASAAGDEDAFRRLVSGTYDELRRIGRSQLRRRRSSLQTTALVHEAFIRLAGGSSLRAGDEQHFYAIAARAMRNLVVDEMRARGAAKRGAGQEPLPLQTSIYLVADAQGDDGEQVLLLDEVLERLADVDPDLARLVEQRVFAGLTEPEIAEASGVSVRTVQRQWRRAKAWLAVALTDAGADGSSNT